MDEGNEIILYIVVVIGLVIIITAGIIYSINKGNEKYQNYCIDNGWDGFEKTPLDGFEKTPLIGGDYIKCYKNIKHSSGIGTYKKYSGNIYYEVN